MYAPFRDQIVRRFMAASEATIERLGQPERHRYGSSDAEYIELFRTARAAHRFSPSSMAGRGKRARFASSVYREMLVSAGVHCALIEFTGVEEAHGRLLTLAEQVRRAIAWLYDHAMEFGGDPNRLVLGDILRARTSRVRSSRPTGRRSENRRTSSRARCCAADIRFGPGEFIEAQRLRYFDEESLDALSPIRHLERIGVPVVVAYGTEETPEFQRQAREFAAALTARNKAVQLLVGIGYNHFDILESLANPFGMLGRAVLQLLEP